MNIQFNVRLGIKNNMHAQSTINAFQIVKSDETNVLMLMYKNPCTHCHTCISLHTCKNYLCRYMVCAFTSSN